MSCRPANDSSKCTAFRVTSYSLPVSSLKCLLMLRAFNTFHSLKYNKKAEVPIKAVKLRLHLLVLYFLATVHAYTRFQSYRRVLFKGCPAIKTTDCRYAVHTRITDDSLWHLLHYATGMSRSVNLTALSMFSPKCNLMLCSPNAGFEKIIIFNN
jgi:hypothetical protein